MLIACYCYEDGSIWRADDVSHLNRKMLNRCVFEYNNDSSPYSVRIEEVSENSLAAFLLESRKRRRTAYVDDAAAVVNCIKDALSCADDLLCRLKSEEDTNNET